MSPQPQPSRCPVAFPMPLIHIDSISDPRLTEYVGVREAELRRNRYDAPGGLFIAEGELVFRRLLDSPYITRSVLTTNARLATIADALARLGPDVPVYVVDQATMNGVVGFNIHRGLLAIGERGPEPDLDALLAAARCAIVLEDLANHDNMGGVFRNAAALGGACFGSTAILLSPRCADPLYRKSIRVSMGAALLAPFATLAEWPGDLERLRRAGYLVAALTPDEGAVDIAEVEAKLVKAPQPVALMLGAEGPGLSASAMEQADIRVRIAMPGRSTDPAAERAGEPRSVDGAEEEEDSGRGVDSLNVAVAGAIALHRVFPHSRRVEEPGTS